MWTKEQFFDDLSRRLRGLPEEERERITRYYEELFEQARLSGKKEHEVVKALGYPKAAIDTDPVPRRIEKGARTVIASVALGFLNLVFVFPIVMTIGCVFLSFALASGALMLSPAVVMLTTGSPANIQELVFQLSASLFLFGAGLLVAVLVTYAGRWAYGLLRVYVAMNLRVVRGG